MRRQNEIDSRLSKEKDNYKPSSCYVITHSGVYQDKGKGFYYFKTLFLKVTFSN